MENKANKVLRDGERNLGTSFQLLDPAMPEATFYLHK